MTAGGAKKQRVTLSLTGKNKREISGIGGGLWIAKAAYQSENSLNV